MSYQYLPRSTPEKAGLDGLTFHHLLKKLEENKVEVHNMMVTVGGKVVFSYYNEPYQEDRPHILHSLTKLFTNTAVAQAQAEGYINLSDKVISFFEDEADKYLPENISDNLKAMTIEDLITMRCGHNREISGSEWRPLKTSWIKAFFEEPVVHKPGDYYCYSSGNSYMLSAIVQKVTGKTAHQYLEEGILNKLGIDPFTWDKSPEGINSGGNGISIRVEDALKIGLLYQQQGKWNGEQLISQEWIDHAFGYKNAKPAPNVEGPYGYPYNYHFFEFGDIYSASGIFGQNAMVIPKLDMVIVVFAATVDWATVPMVAQSEFVAPILEKESEPKPKKVMNKSLSSNLFNGTLLHDRKSVVPTIKFTPNVTSYTVDENEDNITSIGFQQLDEETLVFHMVDDRGRNVVHNGVDRWISSVSGVTGNYLHHQYQSDHAHVVTKAWWETERDLCMEWRFIGTAFCDYLIFSFDDEGGVTMNRWVNINTQAMERAELLARKS